MSVWDTLSRLARWDTGMPAPGPKSAAPAPEYKSALPLPPSLVSASQTAVWSAANNVTYLRQYTTNSAIQACVGALASGFAEAPLKVYRTKANKPWPQHPLQHLLDHPNPLMGQGALLESTMVARATTGNGYWYQVPTAGGRYATAGPIAELWPYHGAEMVPVATATDWVAWYAYIADLSAMIRVEQAQMLHWRWLFDPLLPGAGLSPLQAVLRETDSDDELTRFVKALLQNDAMPRTGLKVPAGLTLTPDEAARLKRDWGLNYGGERRGSVGILYGGLEPVRIALGLNELEVEAIRNAFEARIAAVLRTPPIIAQLYVGLVHGREGNYESTLRLWAEQTLIPAWTALASEINRALVPQYEDDIYVAFDLTKVRALTDNEDTRHARLLEELRSGVLTIDEYRAEKGRAPLPDGAGVGRLFAADVTSSKPPQPLPAGATSTPDGGTSKEPPA